MATDRGLPILDSRVKSMAQLLGKVTAKLDDEMILDVVSEIGLENCVRYTDSYKDALTYDLTPLQLTALASALAAIVEFQDSAR